MILFKSNGKNPTTSTIRTTTKLAFIRICTHCGRLTAYFPIKQVKQKIKIIYSGTAMKWGKEEATTTTTKRNCTVAKPSVHQCEHNKNVMDAHKCDMNVAAVCAVLVVVVVDCVYLCA